MIYVTLRQNKHNLLYEITNSCSPEAPSKKKGDLHGYGLKNVERSVQRNQGYMDVQQKDGSFVVSIQVKV